jgi:hypothetical protein
VNKSSQSCFIKSTKYGDELYCNDTSSVGGIHTSKNITKLEFSRNANVNGEIDLRKLKFLKNIDLSNIYINCSEMFKISNDFPLSNIYFRKCKPEKFLVKCKFN